MNLLCEDPLVCNGAEVCNPAAQPSLNPSGCEPGVPPSNGTECDPQNPFYICVGAQCGFSQCDDGHWDNRELFGSFVEQCQDDLDPTGLCFFCFCPTCPDGHGGCVPFGEPCP